MSRPGCLHQCLGLGRSGSPYGLVCDPDSGRYALADAVNVDVVEGRVRRRPGYVRLLDQAPHSLFSDGPNLYGVIEDRLCLIPGQGEPRTLRDGLTLGAPLAALAVGDRVYFANGFETGLIRDGAVEPWRGDAYPGPDRTGRYVAPPAGHRLALHAGRIWIARDDLVFHTEGAGLFDWVDSLAGFLPPATGPVRLLRAVAGGLFIGDDAGVTFAAGNDPKTMTFARVCPRPPLAGSDVTLPPGWQDPADGQAALWAARDGVYLGRGNGQVQRLADADLPEAGSASAVVTRTRYLLTLHP